MTRRVRIALSTACAVLSVALFAAYANHVRGEADRVRLEALERYGGEVVTLAVARVALEPGDVVTSSNVTMSEWLIDLAPEGAVTSFDEVVGREVGVPLSKGAPLTEVTFRSASEMAEVPAGCVAVTIPITDKLGVPRTVATGATLAAYEVTAEGSSLISGNMCVLASPGAVNSMTAGLQLTVAVPADDVERVLTAAATSDLRLVMPAKDAQEGLVPHKAEPPVELGAGEEASDAATARPGAAEAEESAAGKDHEDGARE